METIIKRAIDGGYANDKPEYARQHLITGFEGDFRFMVLDPLFWQSLGKACGWKENTFYQVVCAVGQGEEYWFDSSCKNEKSDWLKHSIYFHEINLTEGWDAAVSWLNDLIK